MSIFNNHFKNIEERLDDLIKRLTLEEKIYLMPTNQRGIERLGINEYVIGGEAAHGLAWLGKATSFPQPIGLSSTWNTKLMNRIGETIGKEARVYYQKLNKKRGLTLWAPTVDLLRDPRWGRTEEGYGEDPLLTSMLARSFVEGMQGNHQFYKRALSTLKHYMGNNNEKNRLVSSSNIDNRNKYEYYIKPFKEIIKNYGAFSIMPAYNSVNGLPCIIDPEMKDIIKQSWGLEGYIVSDAGDMKMLVDSHKYCSSYAEAVSLVIKSGVDSINDEAELVVTSIKEALQLNLLEESDLNRAIKNVFRGRIQLGEFDPDHLNPYSSIPEEYLCCEENNLLSLEAARESIVLLKNTNNSLPLNTNLLKSVAVVGPLSNVLYRDWYSGDFSYKVTPLQGIINRTGSAIDVNFHNGNDYIAIKSKKTGKYLSVNQTTGEITASGEQITDNEIFEYCDWGWNKKTIKSMLNDKYVTFQKEISATAEEAFGWFVREVFSTIDLQNGVSIKTWNNKSLSVIDDKVKFKESHEESNDLNEVFELEVIVNGENEAMKVANQSDTVIVFVGNNPLINGKEDEDRPGLELPESQLNLIKNMYNINKNVVVCIVGSYPFTITEVDNLVPSILYASHGSQELGNALAEVLFGDYSPAGRLSMTWYRNLEGLTDIFDYDIINGGRTYLYYKNQVLYPFGHGLTYTKFTYSDLTVKNTDDVNVVVCFDITNTGLKVSDEVVQVYVRCNSNKLKRPLKELMAFEKVNLNPSENRKIEFSIPISKLAYWNVREQRYSVEEAVYTFSIGSSSEDIRLEQDIKIMGNDKPSRSLKTKTKAENYDYAFNVLLSKSSSGEQVVYTESEQSWLLFNDVILEEDTSLELYVNSYLKDLVIEVREGGVLGALLDRKEVAKIGEWYSVNLDISCLIEDRKSTNLCIKFSKGVYIDWIKMN
ncbi:glycoside hydrolase family 3 C-terminal domain-containing protein [Paenibacillus sp. FSL K6-4396]|uniref:glycoside hydrolase family 3 C-terminal domain-containing protein n=1 Tax=unclassified Paenibacillus TaxID=185978 RepID=UPI001782DAE6|nr:glycoside hydrolase family 3 C-terminal domain-containing protein [Paenibacillus sp. CFBP 13594]MBD8839084.1 glycoside hydrolase family 3 C-terminal domain-containing protein [Paenibacillus sp. CFBP 13594]